MTALTAHKYNYNHAHTDKCIHTEQLCTNIIIYLIFAQSFGYSLWLSSIFCNAMLFFDCFFLLGVIFNSARKKAIRTLSHLIHLKQNTNKMEWSMRSYTTIDVYYKRLEQCELDLSVAM